MATGLDVMLDPIVKLGVVFTSPVRKIEGNFAVGFLHHQAWNQEFFYKRGESLTETGFP